MSTEDQPTCEEKWKSFRNNTGYMSESILVILSVLITPIFIVFFLLLLPYTFINNNNEEQNIESSNDTFYGILSDFIIQLWPVIFIYLIATLLLILFFLLLFKYKNKVIMITLASLIFIFIIMMELLTNIREGMLPPNYLVIAFMISSFIFSFIILRISVSLVMRIKIWIFEEDKNKTELIRYKLSFINKIIVGFISIVASIIGIILTIQQIIE